jgi:hypothetical protein
MTDDERSSPILTVDDDAGRPLAQRHHNLPKEVFGRAVDNGHGPHFGSLELESHKTGEYVTAYLHGRLESRLRYDIPFLLAGKIEDVAEQDVLVIDPETPDEPIPAILMLFRRDYPVGQKHYGLIVVEADAASARKTIRTVYQQAR